MQEKLKKCINSDHSWLQKPALVLFVVAPLGPPGPSAVGQPLLRACYIGCITECSSTSGSTTTSCTSSCTSIQGILVASASQQSMLCQPGMFLYRDDSKKTDNIWKYWKKTWKLGLFDFPLDFKAWEASQRLPRAFGIHPVWISARTEPYGPVSDPCSWFSCQIWYFPTCTTYIFAM